MPVEISLAICFWYNTVGPSISRTETCEEKKLKCKNRMERGQEIENG